MLQDCFEVKEQDLSGRIGALKTKSGVLETPYLFPVINPNFQPVHAKELPQFGFPAVITNSYLIWKRAPSLTSAEDVHRVIDFKGIVATDSGAYQILQYGEVDVPANEIVRFQERINTDIGVILDIPTGANPDRKFAEHSVRETIKRADDAKRIFTRDDILWEAPVQGGIHLDLVRYSARKMAQKSFPIYALGSPTPTMEQYSFDYLVDMIATTREFVRSNKPLHLFGAGHPMMLCIAVAMGCDLFDSAAYALFARAERYLTSYGTFKLRDLSYFPCSCPECRATDPDAVRNLDSSKRETFLARHNLYVTSEEIRTIKQAIIDGRLWELVSARSRVHPALHDAFGKLAKHAERLEEHTPSVKKRGIFVSEAADLLRPEVLRHKKKLLENYRKPRKAKTLLMVPASLSKRSNRSLRQLRRMADQRSGVIHTCLYGSPYQIIPEEMAESFPLAQTQISSTISREDLDLNLLARYLRANKYRKVTIAQENQRDDQLLQALRSMSRRSKFKLQVASLSRGSLSRRL